MKKQLNRPSVGNESTAVFNMAELKNAVKKMKAKGAAGMDDIPPTFLKALGPLAMEELLAIFNQSFGDSEVPQVWREAIIIPLLKATNRPVN